MTDINKLEHGKHYMVRIPDGSSPRICKWTTRLEQFWGVGGDRDIEPCEVVEVRGPIVFENLPVVDKLAG